VEQWRGCRCTADRHATLDSWSSIHRSDSASVRLPAGVDRWPVGGPPVSPGGGGLSDLDDVTVGISAASAPSSRRQPPQPRREVADRIKQCRCGSVSRSLPKHRGPRWLRRAGWLSEIAPSGAAPEQLHDGTSGGALNGWARCSSLPGRRAEHGSPGSARLDFRIVRSVSRRWWLRRSERRAG
jgi:hypothetical protein